MKDGSPEDKPYWLPEDEYDPYLQQLIRKISGGATLDELVGYVGEVESNFLGLSNPKGDKSEFVRRMIADGA